MSLNVNKNVTDPFYRYKMPRLIAKVEGKGNGIKTVIANMSEIAKALSRPPTYPTKFFGCELGAQTQFDEKNERYIVNGLHEAGRLQELLYTFIDKFVLCQECDNPETTLAIQPKKGIIAQRCIACGHQGYIDMRHKLTTFILKNPPDVEPSTTPSKKEKGGKRSSKRSSKKEVNGDHAADDNVEDPPSPEQNAQEQSAAARTGGEVIAPPRNDADDDDDWGEDVTEDAVKKRMEELSSAAKNLALNEDMEKTVQERADLFFSYVQTKKETGMTSGSDKDILAEAERLDVKDKAVLILCEVLLTENILKELKDYRILLLRFTHENQKAQRYLLGGVEQLVGNVHKDKLMPKVCAILKTLYDLDIVDEEVITEWGSKVSKKYVSKSVSQEIHDAADPFLKWLKEAEEESEEEEEEDLEIEYSHKAPAGQLKTEKPVVQQQQQQEEEDEDDIDIDDI